MLLQRIKQLTLIVIGFATLAGLALALLPELVAGPDASAAKSFVARTAAQAADEKKPAGPGRIHFYRQGRLQSMTPDGKDPQWHSDEKPGEEGLPTHARLSPDGKRIAYGTRPRREPGEDQGLRRIFIRGVDEQGPGEELPVQGVGWCWSPDSTRLAIITGEPGKTILNVIVELKTKKVTELKLAGFHFVTDWTPDGQWLLATRMQEKPTPLAQLCLVNVHSFEVKELTGAERYCFDGRMSPDGNKVLFSSTEKLGPDARRFVWMMHLKEKKPRQVTFEQNGDLQGYCWAPDSERFAYVWRQRHADRTQVLIDTESFLVVSDLEGKNPVTLVTEKANQAYIISLAWLDWR